MHYLVDGYNLMFARRKLEGHEAPVEEMRESLVQMLGAFSRTTRRRVTVVFDGGAEQWDRRDGHGGPVEVIYSHRSTDADTVIARRIMEGHAGRHLCVVSDDRQVRDAARKHGATVARCEPFLKEVRRAVERKLRRAEPPEKYRGLSDEEARVWERMMGLHEGPTDGTDAERRAPPPRARRRGRAT